MLFTCRCNDTARIVAALDQQKPAFLAKIEVLLEARQRAQSEQELRVQQRIQALGRCPMNFSWLRVPGGWRCAGGSHYLSEAAVGSDAGPSSHP